MNSSPTQRREDKGFTLIELMVVVLIIAILLAIAIPTFLGAQNKAKDRSAQSSARNALTNAKTIFADTGLTTRRQSVAPAPHWLPASRRLTFVVIDGAIDRPEGRLGPHGRHRQAWYGRTCCPTPAPASTSGTSVGLTGSAGTMYGRQPRSRVHATGRCRTGTAALTASTITTGDKW